MRYFLDISYVGTRYAGWQVQNKNPNVTTIQQVLSKALSTVLRKETECFASGRTDAGVHATHQIVQFDTIEPIQLHRWVIKLNSLLPHDIVANKVLPVRLEASARFDAESRTYLYKISTERNPFLVERALFVYKPIDLNLMNEATKILFQHEDFEAFSKVHTDVNHFICHIKKAEWTHEGELLCFTIQANRFLRGMVRTIVGTLLDIGAGKTSLKEFEAIILQRDRKKAGHAVSPSGLYLTNVEYPPNIYL
jgi:tRNA pseudouridine38-40 synthase